MLYGIFSSLINLFPFGLGLLQARTTSYVPRDEYNAWHLTGVHNALWESAARCYGLNVCPQNPHFEALVPSVFGNGAFGR